MRVFLASLLALCGLTAQAFGQVPSAYRSTQVLKPEGAGMPRALAPLGIPGGDFTTPIVISSLPYSATGNNCGFVNNLQGSCGGTGPDVVYAITPSQNTCVTISLCNPTTNFDSVLDLYLNSSATLVACSDDFCDIRSEIQNVTLFAGNTYYIVVDGFGGSCGDYLLNVTACPTTCNVPCPPGAIAEGEPSCFDGSVDTYNAGCNSVPTTWTDIPCSPTPVTMCGSYGNFVTNGLQFRDTDWYRVVVGQPTTLVATVNGELSSVVAILDLSAGCGALVERCPVQPGPPCAPISCSASVPAGTYFIFVAPANFSGSPCSARYTLTVSSSDCTTLAKSRTWGSLKALYR